VQIELIRYPTVVLLGHTVPSFGNLVSASIGDQVLKWCQLVESEDSAPCEKLLEFAGRNCYQSWNRPNPKTSTTEGYIQNLIKQRHLSVLEHASFTVYIEGISRSCSHQIVRHRHFSFSQLSYRYVDALKGDVLRIVVPPLYRNDSSAIERLREVAEAAAKAYRDLTDSIGPLPSKKSLYEAARAVLPHMLETKLVMTGNLRAWYEFFEKRLSVHADAEIREVARRCFTIAYRLAPSVFGGFAASGIVGGEEG